MKKTEDLFTANRLALLSKLDRRAIEKKLATITPAKKEGHARYYRLADVLPVLCAESDDVDRERRIQEHREREAKAKADTLEIELGAKIKKYCPIECALELFRDHQARLRVTIEGAEYIPMKDREKLAEQFQQVTLDEYLKGRVTGEEGAGG